MRHIKFSMNMANRFMLNITSKCMNINLHKSYHWYKSKRMLTTSGQDIDQYFAAAKSGSVEMLNNLGTDTINIRDQRGWTLLMHSCRHGHLPVIQHLIKSNCNIELKNPTGQTAIELALFWKQTEVANYLINYSGCGDIEKKSVFFTQNPLERHSELRGDETWLFSTMQKATTKFVLLHKSQPVVVTDLKRSTPRKTKLKLLQCSILDVHEWLKNEGQNLIFLGMYSNHCIDAQDNKDAVLNHTKEDLSKVPWFALDISDVDMKNVQKINNTATCMNVYPGVLQMTAAEASIIAQARSLTDWHFRFKFCSTCGSDTFLSDSGYKRICKDPSCLSHTGIYNSNYPRVDPTIITAVLTPDKKYCLLGRKKAFPPGMFTCLAGFVEPGESMETACIREVQEEAGIKINQVEYIASQPWPMPSALMLGLHAYATSKADIKLDDNELEEADWFSREEVVKMLTHYHNKGLFVPPPQAIAHHLIRKWVLSTT